MAKLKFYLDARHVSVKTGEAPLKLAVTNLSRTAYIATGISLDPKYWDAKKEKVVGHPQKKSLNDKIEAKRSEMVLVFQKIEAEINIDALSANEIRDEIIMRTTNKRVNVKDDKSVVAVFKKFMDLKNGSTREIYHITLKRILAFEGKAADKLRFEHITKEWLMRFDQFLTKTCPSANTRAISMRNIRAVFNFAIDNEITTAYPFRRFKIKGEPTRKRNFDVETLRHIFNAENLEPWMERYRDLFKLTFMLIGINICDLCHLKEIHDGRIDYVRAKTRKLYSIKLEPEAEEIIAKYRGDNYLLNYMDTNKNYRRFYNNVCKGLKAVKERVNQEFELSIDTLTTYWARHSWATIAASLDIPKETIAAGLGHSSHSVTDIYIQFDPRKVDEANRRVLNWVLYGWEGGYAPDDGAENKRLV
ncbi:MAG: site-specific integrase [Muribaculaceae bacterium]|nr:site-specific integrase [Muribaculaceae bacterium]